MRSTQGNRESKMVQDPGQLIGLDHQAVGVLEENGRHAAGKPVQRGAKGLLLVVGQALHVH
jgi:hypothetical protein